MWCTWIKANEERRFWPAVERRKVFSLRRALIFLSHSQVITGRVQINCKTLEIFGYSPELVAPNCSASCGLSGMSCPCGWLFHNLHHRQTSAFTTAGSAKLGRSSPWLASSWVEIASAASRLSKFAAWMVAGTIDRLEVTSCCTGAKRSCKWRKKLSKNGTVTVRR